MAQILAWADDHHRATGVWPTADSGLVRSALGERWHNLSMALLRGCRGLPGGSSLAKLLAEHRGVRNRKGLPPFTPGQILAWADAHQAAHGRWPCAESGSIVGAPGETWMALDMALRVGCRGLPGASSLAKLLAAGRGVRHCKELPTLSAKQILIWADAHHARTGMWPSSTTGPVEEAPGETWQGLHGALNQGGRGLPGGSSLARLLAERRRVPYHRRLAPLTETQILGWADAYHARTGAWPTSVAGPIPESPGLTWLAVHLSLKQGLRGLPGETTLAHFLVGHGRGRNRKGLRPLVLSDILAWAEDHHRTTGRWPKATSGPVAAAPGETWMAVHVALSQGRRGLPGGSSLPQFLAPYRGER